MATSKSETIEKSFESASDIELSRQVSEWLNFTGKLISISSWVDNDLMHRAKVCASFGNPM